MTYEEYEEKLNAHADTCGKCDAARNARSVTHVCDEGRDIVWKFFFSTPPPLTPAPWSTPKAGDACESGTTEKQQAGWASLTRQVHLTKANYD